MDEQNFIAMLILYLFQIREARKLEQMNNPHYLKGTTKNKKIDYEEGIECIPVAELDLSVPLKIQKRSDKYLSMDREKKSSKAKKKKKSRKNKDDDR